jgi:hypothetical protein
VHLKIDGLLQCRVVTNDERAEEPGPHDVVEEVVFAVPPGHVLSGSYTGDSN